MGSSGSGQFGNLRPNLDENKCERALKDVSLEDVALCEYYRQNEGVPSITHPVQVREGLFHGRIAVESLESNLVIGYLPSIYSYIPSCIKQGYSYVGNVTYSSNSVVPKVIVNLDVVNE
ncbi:hypothetical protein [Brevibacillus sp. 179-C9.3 HS]|uniref:hypothetical protein n=1 Tax=unclassified Brevibacillus TaxID=2684853 RepID=UPI00399EEC71